MVVICGAGNANSLEAHGSPRVYYCWGLYSQTCCFIFTSVVSSINVEAHRWCCGCRGSIGGVWLSWSHRWGYGCRGNIGGAMIVVDASVVLWLSW